MRDVERRDVHCEIFVKKSCGARDGATQLSIEEKGGLGGLLLPRCI